MRVVPKALSCHRFAWLLRGGPAVAFLGLLATSGGCAAAPPPVPPAPAKAPATTGAPKTVLDRVVVTPPLVLQTPDAPFRAQAPSAGPEPTFRVPEFKRFKLKNGTDVILAEVRDLPLVELHLVVKTGGGANPPNQAGLADLTANLLDDGTKTRSALQIAEQIGALGATLSTSSSWDASIVSLSTITRSLDAAVAIWADVIAHPAFADKELARVRDNLLTAVTRRKDSPPTLANLILTKVLFGEKNPYGWPLTGVEASLKKLSAADVRRFYAAHYRPTNATIIATGAITESELRAKLEPALRDWKGAKTPPPTIPPPVELPSKRIFLIDKPGAPQSSIRVGFLGVRRSDPDYFPILLMNQILGGAFYRLDMNLRERQQWTYGARSSFDMRRTPGLGSAGGEFVASHTADAIGEILKEMRTISSTEVTDEEMGRAKDNFVRSFPARFATRGTTAALLAELAIYGLPDKTLVDYTKNIEAVTKTDVLRVAKRFLAGEKFAIVVVGDRAAHETALRKLAPLELRDLEGAPVSAPPSARDIGPTGSARPGGAQD